MDTMNPTVVFKSDCYYTRVTVEAALIHVAPTIPQNTATTSVQHNELVAPMICRATRFNWQELANCIPSLNKNVIHQHKRQLFGNQQIVRPPASERSQTPDTPIALRTRRRLGEGHHNNP
ncbi:unnamed protein product [Meganyctiphanes norvegica]|uniref:Uncharacterized protein n=2 Tax=Meganyctiphanes norvegica TaxID=48144 RepID=A0AAV2SS28_MEGNR